MSDMARTVARLMPAAIAEVGADTDDVRIDTHPIDADDGLRAITGSDTLWINHLDSGRRRNGAARAAMAGLCMLADRHDCRLALNPWAQSMAGTLDQLELERFYQSLGFGWRRDHIMVREPHVPTVVHVRRDVAYLPSPNRVELVLDTTPTPIRLTRSSFVVPVMDDGSIVMANNRRRGLEVPGGHIEEGESQEEAGGREGFEETGARLGRRTVLGHLRMTSSGTVPEGWRYPHPLSYQSFFAARVVSMDPYVENDECLAPVVMSDLSTLKPHVRLMALRARAILGIGRT